MWNIWMALLFMLLGGAIVHIAWVHSWRMYRKGKAEGAQAQQQPGDQRVRTGGLRG